MNVPPIFKDSHQQQLFNKQGFLVVPFLTNDEVGACNALFDSLHRQNESSGFYSGSYSGDSAYKQKASQEIVSIFSRAYADLFKNYTPFGASFLYKVPGKNSHLSAHQDWTIVDEKKAVALNCWVPLTDITEDNGPLMVLPGSQFANLNTIRCPTLPFFFSGNDELVMQELEPQLVPSGTAVILNQSLIHYSPPNTSSNTRRAITAGVKTSGAQMCFHYKIPDKDVLEVFEMPDDFLLGFKDFASDIGKRPYMGKSIGMLPYALPQFSPKELSEALSEMKTKAGFISRTPKPASVESESWWKKFKRFF